MVPALDITPAMVVETREWTVDRGGVIVPLINEVRDSLGKHFDTEVEPVEPRAYRDEVYAVFDDGDVAPNAAAMIAILRHLDVVGDHPGFVVDELVGRELAATIAGEQPLRLLAEATFHVADATHHPDDGSSAGVDDLDAALAAGFQTRLPGWPWRQMDGPFDDLPG